ncbi:N-acetylmuramoyl-L-alanine amidase family protein [Butyrivibrio sp. AE2032]|uniref:N-acetylmuramoyl-L-alanine amidase family protein n=1 Tax=Butyrivibrio sp. AE2032 TaxID=1458463 RepID=UPI00068F1F70|nr:N-acetylmuramoyl-L-alanine amidase family protein [Butyrivibrio sp. AE2032]
MKAKSLWKKITAAVLTAALSAALIHGLSGDNTVNAKTADILITTAGCTVNLPLDGTAPDMKPVACDLDKYYVELDYWYPRQSPYPHMESTDRFEEGKEYFVRIKFYPKDGYKFDDNTVFYINGDIAHKYGSGLDDYEPLESLFTCGTSKTELLPSVNITITKPVVGASPDMFPVSSDTSKYKVVFCYWYIYEYPYWHLTSDYVFEEGKTYALRVMVIPKNGYKTDFNDTKFYVNGEYRFQMWALNGAEMKYKPVKEGWYLTNGEYYYYTDNVLQKGWFLDGNCWYYADTVTGVMAKFWQQIDGAWYYFGSNGQMRTGWQQIGGVWYYFGTNGKMRTDWQQISGKWYYFGSNGKMRTSWQQIGGTWYYFESSGAMVTGWKQISGTYYFFKTNGAMAANEYCGGYRLDADGKWTYTYKASWKKDSKGWWYGDSNGWYAKNETWKIDGKNYNFDKSGYCTNP